MLQRTSLRAFKMPKNLGVAPQYDTWNQKWEPWSQLRSMGKLVGTGFYIPPEWYNHFRMFPPIQNNFAEELTQNPHSDAEPTQARFGHYNNDYEASTAHGGTTGGGGPSGDNAAQRRAIREELGHRSRSLASEGMRYYNIFWIQKPLDMMERRYYQLKLNGASHEDAMSTAVEAFHQQVANKKRVSAIQAEEAQLSGGFITMREASAVLGALVHMEKHRFTPQDAAELAEQKQLTVSRAPVKRGRARWVKKTPQQQQQQQQQQAATTAATATTTETAAAAAAAPAPATTDPQQKEQQEQQQQQKQQQQQQEQQQPTSADLFAFLEDESGFMTVDVEPSPHDSLPALKEVGTNMTGDTTWYDKSSNNNNNSNSNSSSPTVWPAQNNPTKKGA